MKTKNDKIVFVNQSSGYLMIDIVNVFAASGNYAKIALVAGEIKDMERLNKNVKIYRITRYSKNNVRQRFVSWIVGTVQALFIVLRKMGGYHLFLSSNPPITSFITLLCRNTYSTLVLDVYPEGLVLGGFVSRNSPINKIWSRFNRRFYKKAQHVFTLTDGMAERIKKDCPHVNVQVIPVWNCELKGTPENKNGNIFLNLYGLQNKFVVMYSGNMGKGHDIDALVYVANNLKEDPDIVFIFIGEGWKKTHITDLIQDMSLENCMTLPYQPAELLPHSLTAADVGIVCVPTGGGDVCVPSKTYNLIALGIPVLGIAEKNSEIFQLIEKYKIGACFSKDDIQGITAFISTLKNNEQEKIRYGKNALSTAVHYSSENAREFVNALHAPSLCQSN